MSLRVVGLGEVLWDELPAGRQLGGAPANFAYHAAALGARADVVSRVGSDLPGREIIAALGALGLGASAISVDASAPTSTVSVRLGADGQPQYTIHEGVAWDFLADDPAARAVVAAADAVCFGTLAQRSAPARAALRRLVSATRPEALRIFDANLRQHYHSPEVIADSLALASMLKVNETELPRLATQFALGGDERAQLAALAQRFRLRAIAYTRGAAGCLVLADGHWVDLPGRPVRVVDTVGAGDSFTAALAVGLLHRWPLAVAVERASEVAAFVCTQAGATPVLPAGLRAPFLAAAAP